MCKCNEANADTATYVITKLNGERYDFQGTEFNARVEVTKNGGGSFVKK